MGDRFRGVGQLPHRRQGERLPVNERVDFFFACIEWDGEPRIMEPARAAQLAWFHLDALPADVVPHERYVPERLRTGLAAIVPHGFAD